MKKLSQNLISLILGLSCLVAGEAFSASLDICEALLKARPFKESDWKAEVPSKKPSVKIGSSTVDDKGATRSLLTRIGRSWQSDFIVDQTALAMQGDPRTFALLLGGELAHFLGVSIVDENNMVVPNSIELNSRIEKLNAKLTQNKFEEIQMRFTDVTGIVDEFTFVRQFLQSTLTPIARDGDIRIHDISYHLGGIVVPNAMLEDVRKVLDMDLRFARFLTDRLNKIQGTPDEELYQWLIAGQYGMASAFLDTVLGNTVAFMSNTKELMRSGTYEIKDQKLIAHDTRFKDVKRVLESEYANFFGDIEKPTLRTAFASRIYRYPPGSFTGAEAQLLEKERADFIAQSPDLKWDEPLGRYAPEFILYQVNQRIEEMQKALATP